jgi:hypothetical protein
MLRARAAIGLCAAASLAGTLVLLDGGSAPEAAPGDSCFEPEASYTTDSLHDIRSFADAMAIVRGVRQAIPLRRAGPRAGPASSAATSR